MDGGIGNLPVMAITYMLDVATSGKRTKVPLSAESRTMGRGAN